MNSKPYQSNKTYNEAARRNHIDEKNATRRLSNEHNNDKQQPMVNVPRAKIMKSNLIMFQLYLFEYSLI